VSVDRHLVTGATGFIGGALVLELLAETSADVVCLVRHRGEDVEDRLHKHLETAARAYGRGELLAQISSRCRAVEGDLTLPECGVDHAHLGPVATVWHSAASLALEQEARARTLRANVDGTAAVLGLARALRARDFVQMSTAYVAGKRTGLVYEEPAPDPGIANNPYEESKILAEVEVLRERGLRTWIMRPGIVIGDSRTHQTLSRAGLYVSLVDAHQFAHAGIEPMLGGRPLYSPGRDDVRCNLIPVDYVVRNAVRIFRSNADGQIFHLTNATPPTLREVTDAVCDAVGMLRTVYVEDTFELTDVERMLAEHPRAQFQHPYMCVDRHFDLAHTDAAIGAEASACRLGSEELAPYLQAFMASERLEPHVPSEHGAGL
jgi:nucleoside-diphosphate-sugar epimerase